VRGGADTGLRLRPTLATLDCLGSRKLLPAQAVAELREAYVFLRNLEHRLQYLEDQQTQTLPASAEDRALVARSMGFADAAGFEAALQQHRGNVTRQFEAVFAGAANRAGRASAERAVARQPGRCARPRTARRAQLRRPRAVLARLRVFRDSGGYRRMSASTQARVDRLVRA